MKLENPPPKPYELTLIGYIDRFGVEPVMGRPVLSAGEIRRMFVVENIVNASLSRRAAMDEGNVAEWARKNQFFVDVLNDVEGIINADSN